MGWTKLSSEKVVATGSPWSDSTVAQDQASHPASDCAGLTTYGTRLADGTVAPPIGWTLELWKFTDARGIETKQNRAWVDPSGNRRWCSPIAAGELTVVAPETAGVGLAGDVPIWMWALIAAGSGLGAWYLIRSIKKGGSRSRRPAHARR